jgi:hypothetical protein
MEPMRPLDPAGTHLGGGNGNGFKAAVTAKYKNCVESPHQASDPTIIPDGPACGLQLPTSSSIRQHGCAPLRTLSMIEGISIRPSMTRRSGA